MYEFIETLHKELSITPNDITALEEEYKISIPTPLKDFYLKYNAAEISLCTFTQKELPNNTFEVHTIYSMKYAPFKGAIILEEVLYGDRLDGFIAANLIPFAEDRGGNRYYCDEKTGNVFFIPCDDIDNPELVCENISDFLNNLKNVEQ